MNSRERVLEALNHREPDRVPIDLGGTDNSGITAIAYNRLKAYLGMEWGKTQVFDMMQQLAKVEEPIRRFARSDVVAILLEPKEWKTSRLPDGSLCEIPAKWNAVKKEDGSMVVYDEGGHEAFKLPKGGYYYEPVYAPMKDVKSASEVDEYAEEIESYDWPFFADEDFEDLKRKAKRLFEETEYALVGCFFGHIYAAGQQLRGFSNFMVDLMSRPEIAEAIMERLVEAYKERFMKYVEAVGDYIQIVLVNDDLGMQEGPQISPVLYRKRIKPYHKELYRFIKENSEAYLLLHSCGSVRAFIPDLIEIGVDALNPVQVSAAGMDTAELKKEFGDKIVFWGGGCDTQKILPFGTSREIDEEVKKRISDLAPNGGFIFTQVHNIQPDVPPENIVSMYSAVDRHGRY